jgi:crossover junction endodeoxyribonuclease RuvC
MQVTIIGVDPGFHVTGYAVISFGYGKTQLLDCGYLKMSPKDHLSRRTGIFYNHFKELIVQHKATQIALETSFLGQNAQTFLKLGYLRGILYLLADQHSIALAEFAPREIKSSVTGFGGASKEQVALMMGRMFPKLNELAVSVRSDVTDALAISLCGAWQYQQKWLTERVTKASQ